MPAGEASSALLPGGPGIMSAGITTGMRGASLEVGDRRRSDPRPLDGLPTKPGPDRTKGPHTPWEEPRWNAGRRARPIAEGAAQAAPSVARPARHMRAGGTARVCRRSASLFICRRRVAKSCSATAQVARSGLVRSPIPSSQAGEANKIRCLTSLAGGVRSRERDRSSSPLPAARGEVERSEGEGASAILSVADMRQRCRRCR